MCETSQLRIFVEKIRKSESRRIRSPKSDRGVGRFLDRENVRRKKERLISGVLARSRPVENQVM